MKILASLILSSVILTGCSFESVTVSNEQELANVYADTDCREVTELEVNYVIDHIDELVKVGKDRHGNTEFNVFIKDEKELTNYKLVERQLPDSNVPLLIKFMNEQIDKYIDYSVFASDVMAESDVVVTVHDGNGDALMSFQNGKNIYLNVNLTDNPLVKIR